MAGAGGREVGRVSIRVVPDLDKFYSELKAKLEEIEKKLKGKIPVELDLDTEGAKEHMRLAMAELKAQAAKGVNVRMNVDKNNLTQAARTLSSFGESAGSAGQSIFGLSRIGWMIAAGFAAAAPAVGLVAGILAGIPSLVAAIAAPIAAVVVGFDGIKKALDDTGFLGPGKKKGKSGAGDLIKQMQEAVSGVFATGLVPVFDKLATLMPTIQGGLVSVAGGMVKMADSIVSVVAGAPGMQQIGNILQQVGTLMAGLGPVMGTFTQSFLTLANAGANNFGKLLGPLQTFAQGFDNVVKRITSNGAFDKAMSGLSVVLTSVLNLFNRLFESGVNAMGQLGGPLANLITSLGNAFIALMPALTSLSTFIANVGSAFLNTLAPAITAVTPAFTMLANTLGTLFVSNLTTITPLLTQLATTLGTSLTTALTTLQPMLPGLVSSFTSFANTLATQLGPILPQVATAFGQLAGALLQISPTILQTLADAFVQLAPQIQPVVTAFTSFLTTVTPLLPKITELASKALELAPAFLAIAPPVLTVVGVLATLAAQVLDGAGKFEQFAERAVTAVGSLPGRILGALGNLGGTLISSGAALIGGFIKGIESMIGAAVAAANRVVSAVRNLFPNSPAKEGPFSGSGWVLYSGQSVGQAFGDGLEQGFQGVADRAKALIQEVADAINGGTSGVDVTQLPDQIKQQLSALELQRKNLKVQSDQTTDPAQRKTLQDQMKQITAMKDQLNLQKDQLGYSQKYGDQTDQNKQSTDYLGQSLNKGGGILHDFVEANVKQFGSDIGIGGNGAVEAGLNYGLQFLGSLISGVAGGGGKGGGTTINVNSVDEALAAKQNITNKQALQYKTR